MASSPPSLNTTAEEAPESGRLTGVSAPAATSNLLLLTVSGSAGWAVQPGEQNPKLPWPLMCLFRKSVLGSRILCSNVQK